MRMRSENNWQNDVVHESAEVEGLKKFRRQFTEDIQASIEDASQYQSQVGEQQDEYAGSDASRFAYFGQLVAHSLNVLPDWIRYDGVEMGEVLKGLSGTISFSEKYARVLFEHVPEALLSDSAFLDAYASLSRYPIFLFTCISPETQRRISREWFQSFWDQQMADGSALRYCVPDDLPWGLLRPDQVKNTIEIIPKNTINDFSKIPHALRDGYRWHEEFQTAFDQALAYNSWYDVEKLQRWPKEYRLGLQYDQNKLRECIVVTDFQPEMVLALYKETGETLSTLGLQKQARVSIDKRLENFDDEYVFSVISALLPFLSESDQTELESYLRVFGIGKFRPQEAGIVYRYWKKELGKDSDDEKIIQHVREYQVRRMKHYLPAEKGKIDKVLHDYSLYTLGSQEAQELLWGHFNSLREPTEADFAEMQKLSVSDSELWMQPILRTRSLFKVDRLLELLKKDEQIKGAGLRNNREVFLAMMEFAQDESTHRIAEKLISLLNEDSIDEYIRAVRSGGRAGILHYYFSFTLSSLALEARPVTDYKNTMAEVKKLREAQRVLLGKGMQGHKEAFEEISRAIREKIALIRAVRNRERDTISAIADAVRVNMDTVPLLPIETVIEQLGTEDEGLLGGLTPVTRMIVVQKVKDYVRTRHFIREYFDRYQYDGKALYQKVFPRHATPDEDVGLDVYGMSLVFLLTRNDFQSKANMAKAGAYATSESAIGALQGTVVVMNRDAVLADGLYKEYLIHENRHQEDALFFRSYENIERAKSEILAYLSEGLDRETILEMMTDVKGLYAYGMKPGPEWEVYCRRVARALDIAIKVGKMDLLAQTPIQQWRQHLRHPSEV